MRSSVPAMLDRVFDQFQADPVGMDIVFEIFKISIMPCVQIPIGAALRCVPVGTVPLALLVFVALLVGYESIGSLGRCCGAQAVSMPNLIDQVLSSS
jgi:hypothetical protein